MRIKTFRAPTMAEVMKDVRVELGPDAIILSSDEGNGKGASVTAAFEPRPEAPEAEVPDISTLMSEMIAQKHAENVGDAYNIEDLIKIMEHHGLPADIQMQLKTAATAFDADTVEDALSSALETSFRFYNLPNQSKRPMILVGPTGAGKTVACAKLAAEAVLRKQKVEIITVDTIKSTGLEQLQNFATLMKCKVKAADNPKDLAKLLEQRPTGDDAPDLTLIDSFGVNPFKQDELEDLARFIKVGQAEPVLVMPAGLDSMDASEMAQIFASMGARLFVPTKMDAVRRYASVLTAAQSGGLSIAAIGNSPVIGDRLKPASPYTLSKMLGKTPIAATH